MNVVIALVPARKGRRAVFHAGFLTDAGTAIRFSYQTVKHQLARKATGGELVCHMSQVADNPASDALAGFFLRSERLPPIR
jgi:hypothetical protein